MILIGKKNYRFLTTLITVIADDLIGSPSSNHEITPCGFDPKQLQTNLTDSPSVIILFLLSMETAIGLTDKQKNWAR